MIKYSALMGDVKGREQYIVYKYTMILADKILIDYDWKSFVHLSSMISFKYKLIQNTLICLNIVDQTYIYTSVSFPQNL